MDTRYAFRVAGVSEYKNRWDMLAVGVLGDVSCSENIALDRLTIVFVWSGVDQVGSDGGIRRSSASPQPPCDGILSGPRPAVAQADAGPAMPVSFR